MFADLECTTRPVVGQTYTDLFIKVNRDTTEDEYDYNPSSSNDCEKLYAAWSTIDSLFDINLYVDFIGSHGNNPILAGTVIITEGPPMGKTIEEGAVFDFG